MSQKTTPRTSRSKSPSCDDGQQGGVPIDDLQEAVAEELRSPDRMISQDQSYGSRGGLQSHMSDSRRGSYQGASQQRMGYQSATSRSQTIYQGHRASLDEDTPRMPSPPTSAITYGSRAGSQVGSQRKTSPLSGRSKPVSFVEMNKMPSTEMDYCEDDGQYTAMSSNHQSFRGNQSYPSMREVPPNSQYSVRGAIGPSQTSMREVPPNSQYSVRGATGPSHVSIKEMAANSQYSARGATGPSHVSIQEMAANSQYSVRGATGPGQVSRAENFGKQSSADRIRMSGLYMGISGIGLSSYSVVEPGVDVGTSAMTYGMPAETPGIQAGGSCVPGCRAFMRDTVNAVTSTPYDLNRDYMRSDMSQSGFSRQFPGASPSAGAGKPSMSDREHMGRHMMKASESGHHAHHGARAPSPDFTRSPPPPSYMRPMSAPGRNHAHGGEEHDHHHDHEGHGGLPEPDEKVLAALGHLSQFKKTPSYYRCGTGNDMDFLKTCREKMNVGKDGMEDRGRTGRVAAFPEVPCLNQEDIDEMIKCETNDVESVRFLSSDERKTYKKPCPKQQKAQMSVKALVQAHAAQSCGQKEYSPLEHPDPDDITPEVAAAMMFSQEKGIKMEECPHYTITSLFPEDSHRTIFPEKIPPSSISIVDRTGKDQEDQEMIEKSADVPSEGVSDSAYTRTMKDKGSEDMGAQKSFDVDFAIGQYKREYVLVAEKPERVNKVQYRGGNTPPWFPGYFSAFPDEEGLKVVASPSGVFHKAWVHSNPSNIPTSDVIVLD